VGEPATIGKEAAGEDRVGGNRDREGGGAEEAGEVT
jgi:hypothetical protein